jgi:hypothetical protein
MIGGGMIGGGIIDVKIIDVVMMHLWAACAASSEVCLDG